LEIEIIKQEEVKMIKEEQKCNCTDVKRWILHEEHSLSPLSNFGEGQGVRKK
jgi:hypothetical protein